MTSDFSDEYRIFSPAKVMRELKKSALKQKTLIKFIDKGPSETATRAGKNDLTFSSCQLFS